MKKTRSQLTYANVISTLCLCLLVGGGTAFAATKLAKNSVGTKQIKNNAITGAKIKNGAVTGSKIAASTLGTVPSAANAAHADSSTDAGHATSATTAANAAHADSANTATSAATASNALKFANEEPSAYLNRVAQAAGGETELTLAANTPVNVTPGTALSITVPSGVGYVVADGSASFGESASAKSTTVLWAEAGESCGGLTGLGYLNRQFANLDTTSSRSELSVHLAFPVTPGAHKFVLCGFVGSSTHILTRSLTLTTAARGAAG